MGNFPPEAAAGQTPLLAIKKRAISDESFTLEAAAGQKPLVLRESDHLLLGNSRQKQLQGRTPLVLKEKGSFLVRSFCRRQLWGRNSSFKAEGHFANIFEEEFPPEARSGAQHLTRSLKNILVGKKLLPEACCGL